jgi:hypothetical protein
MYGLKALAFKRRVDCGEIEKIMPDVLYGARRFARLKPGKRPTLPLDTYGRGIRVVALVAYSFQHGRAEFLLVRALGNLAVPPDNFFTACDAD